MSGKVLEGITSSKNSVIVDYIEKRAGGKSLRELIETGRVLRLNGQRFIPEGEKINYNPDNLLFTDEEYDVLNALSAEEEGGVLFFDDLSTDKPKPCLITTTENDNGIRDLSVSDPLEEDDLEDVIDDFLETKPIPDKNAVDVAEPGIGNRIWDSVLRFFGGKGTQEMISYRAAKAAAESKYNEGCELHSQFEGAQKRVQECSSELANMTRAERNLNKEMKMVEQAMIPNAMGVVPEDQKYYDEFKAAMTEVARNNYKVRALIVNMGMETITTDGHRHPSQLRHVYSAYKTERANGRELDLGKMMESAVNKPSMNNNLTRILNGEKIIQQEDNAIHL